MKYDKFRTQKDVKTKNETKILVLLEKQPLRFKDLKEETGLSQMGLNAILKRLMENGRIEKTLYENHEAYQLTRKGLNYVKGIWMILYEIYEMQNRKTNYDSSYFSNTDINWSSLIEVESPYINYYFFIEKILNEYRELILKSIKDKYIKENEDKTYSLINKEELKGKHMIAFEVDFDLIRKNIEDSLISDVEFDTLLKSVKEGIAIAIKEDIRNLYRHILLKEERKPIFGQKGDKEDDPK